MAGVHEKHKCLHYGAVLLCTNGFKHAVCTAHVMRPLCQLAFHIYRVAVCAHMLLLVIYCRFGSICSEPASLPTVIKELFAACHGLTQLEETVVGDPLDQRLFEASGFEMKFQDGSLAPSPARPAGHDPAPSADGGVAASQPAVGSCGASAGPQMILRRRPPSAIPTSYQPSSPPRSPQQEKPPSFSSMLGSSPGPSLIGKLAAQAHEVSYFPSFIFISGTCVLVVCVDVRG